MFVSHNKASNKCLTGFYENIWPLSLKVRAKQNAKGDLKSVIQSLLFDKNQEQIYNRDKLVSNKT